MDTKPNAKLTPELIHSTFLETGGEYKQGNPTDADYDACYRGDGCEPETIEEFRAIQEAFTAMPDGMARGLLRFVEGDLEYALRKAEALMHKGDDMGARNEVTKALGRVMLNFFTYGVLAQRKANEVAALNKLLPQQPTEGAQQ